MVQVIGRICLPCEHIAAVALVCQDTPDGTGRPGLISSFCQSFELRQGICDLLRRIPIQIGKEYQPYCLCFFFIDHEISVFILVIA